MAEEPTGCPGPLPEGGYADHGPTVSDGLLYDEQGRVVAELDGSNNVLSTFVYGLRPNVPDYKVRGGVAYRIVSDWRGDVRLVLNTTLTGSAAVVQQLDYDAWGNVVHLVDPDCTIGGTALCLHPFGFAGGIWEPSTGLVRFGARDYDPQAARWAQKDPSNFNGGQWNIYVYAGDDPINKLDANGRGLSCCDSSGTGDCLICYAPPPGPCDSPGGGGPPRVDSGALCQTFLDQGKYIAWAACFTTCIILNP